MPALPLHQPGLRLTASVFASAHHAVHHARHDPALHDGPDDGHRRSALECGWLRIDHAARALGMTERGLRAKVQRAQRDGDPRLARLSGPMSAPARDGSVRDQLHIHMSYDARLLTEQRRLLAAGSASGSDPDSSPDASDASDSDGSAVAELLTLPPPKVDRATQRVELVLAWRSAKASVRTADIPAWIAAACARLGIDEAPGKSRLYEMDAACRAACSSLSVRATEAQRHAAMVLRMIDGRGGARRSACSPEAWEYFRGLYLDPRRWSVAKCSRAVAARAAERGWCWPALATVTRLVHERITTEEAVLAREGARAYDRRCKAPMEQHADAYAAGQRWDGDHVRLDFFSRVRRGGQWIALRLWAAVWMDWRSHRIMGWAIDTNADTRLIKLALKRGLADESVSVPEILWIDNGKDFASRELTGATKAERRSSASSPTTEHNTAAWSGLFRMLGMEPHFAAPFNPNAKRVEGMFNYLHQDFCREWSSYCGSDPTQLAGDERARILGAIDAMPTLDEVRQRFGAWVAYYNARSEHAIRDLALDGVRVSPSAYYAARVPAMRRLADPAALSLLDAHWSTPLKAHKWGVSLTPSAAIGTLRYGEHEPELAPYRGSQTRRLIARWDPDDLSSIALHDAASLRLVCVARANTQHHAPGVEEPIGREHYAAARRRQREARRQVSQRIDLTALTAGAHELAAAEARAAAVRATNEALAEAGIDAGQANLRIIRTPIDGQADDQAQRQRLRRAAGAESMDPFHGHDDDAGHHAGSVLDRLAVRRAADDENDNEHDGGSGLGSLDLRWSDGKRSGAGLDPGWLDDEDGPDGAGAADDEDWLSLDRCAEAIDEGPAFELASPACGDGEDDPDDTLGLLRTGGTR